MDARLQHSGMTMSPVWDVSMNQSEIRSRSHQITVHGLVVEVVRKNIKHLHLAIYPPNGWVRVAGLCHRAHAASPQLVNALMVGYAHHPC